MIAPTEYAFYKTGVRCGQALSLMNTSQQVQAKRVTHPSLVRLKRATEQLLNSSSDAGNCGREILSPIDDCLDRLKAVLAEDESRLDEAYDHCHEDLMRLIVLIDELAQQQSADPPTCATWFELGLSIVRGWGTTPWDVPPGREPSEEKARWTMDDPSKVASLRAKLLVCRDDVFPPLDDAEPAPEWLSELPEDLWGWQRVEVGLADMTLSDESSDIEDKRPAGEIEPLEVETESPEAEAESPKVEAEPPEAKVKPSPTEAEPMEARTEPTGADGESAEAEPQPSEAVADLKGTGSGSGISNPKIPRERRTKPMSYREAGVLLGLGSRRKAGRLLSRMVGAGKIKCEPFSVQKHIFDRNDFPLSAWNEIEPGRVS